MNIWRNDNRRYPDAVLIKPESIFIGTFKHGLISHKERPVKLLANGDLEKRYSVSLDSVSAAAKAALEALGGTVKGS